MAATIRPTRAQRWALEFILSCGGTAHVESFSGTQRGNVADRLQSREWITIVQTESGPRAVITDAGRDALSAAHRRAA